MSAGAVVPGALLVLASADRGFVPMTLAVVLAGAVLLMGLLALVRRPPRPPDGLGRRATDRGFPWFAESSGHIDRGFALVHRAEDIRTQAEFDAWRADAHAWCRAAHPLARHWLRETLRDASAADGLKRGMKGVNAPVGDLPREIEHHQRHLGGLVVAFSEIHRASMIVK